MIGALEQGSHDEIKTLSWQPHSTSWVQRSFTLGLPDRSPKPARSRKMAASIEFSEEFFSFDKCNRSERAESNHFRLDGICIAGFAITVTLKSANGTARANIQQKQSDTGPWPSQSPIQLQTLQMQ